MKSKLRIAAWWLREFGLEPWKTYAAFINVFKYFKHYISFRKMRDKSWRINLSSPCLHDFSDQAGVVKGHYFFQDLYVAQKIYQNNPQRHLDIGSRIDGFVAHVASYREIYVLDIRPAELNFANINFMQVDFSSELDVKKICSDSVSCLHALEHFGLGRYGDDISPDAYLAGVENLKRIVSPNGSLYFSVPIGRQRVDFNAHRVFRIKTILDVFSDMALEEFAWVDDEGDFYVNAKGAEADLSGIDSELEYGLGIFVFKKT